jgi:hypothetical protein
MNHIYLNPNLKRSPNMALTEIAAMNEIQIWNAIEISESFNDQSLDIDKIFRPVSMGRFTFENPTKVQLETYIATYGDVDDENIMLATVMFNNMITGAQFRSAYPIVQKMLSITIQRIQLNITILDLLGAIADLTLIECNFADDNIVRVPDARSAADDNIVRVPAARSAADDNIVRVPAARSAAQSSANNDHSITLSLSETQKLTLIKCTGVTEIKNCAALAILNVTKSQHLMTIQQMPVLTHLSVRNCAEFRSIDGNSLPRLKTFISDCNDKLTAVQFQKTLIAFIYMRTESAAAIKLYIGIQSQDPQLNIRICGNYDIAYMDILGQSHRHNMSLDTFMIANNAVMKYIPAMTCKTFCAYECQSLCGIAAVAPIHMFIHGCPNIKYIYANSKISTISVHNCAALQNFEMDHYTFGTNNKLQRTIHISNCNNLAEISRIDGAYIAIYDCNMLTSISELICAGILQICGCKSIMREDAFLAPLVCYNPFVPNYMRRLQIIANYGDKSLLRRY